ncbi:MAG: hypothetical protein KDD40_11400 [Bdellovibrionales bacterium]|nr:hypothetical protein [Bdellovibrionales bacterium]
MSTLFKWAEIARTPFVLRYELLSEYLNSKGFKNEFTYLEVQPTEFEQQLQLALKNYQALRLGTPYGTSSLSFFNCIPANIAYLNAADYVYKNSHWELGAATLWGFEKLLNDQGQNINLDYSALIVGSGTASRFAIHALIKIGIKHINISNQFSEQAKELIIELEKKYFGVQFEYVPDDELVLLPGTNSVLVNTTPLIESNSILKELYYFNFLRADGLVVDFTFLPIKTPLITEAEQIGLKAIRGYQVIAWGDIEWAKKFTTVPLDYQEYCDFIIAAEKKWSAEKEKSETGTPTENETRF